MTIEITMVDIICRFIAFISVFLCVVLYFYERYKTTKWFKEKSKDELKEKDNDDRRSIKAAYT